jgi:hypothetical protein
MEGAAVTALDVYPHNPLFPSTPGDDQIKFGLGM